MKKLRNLLLVSLFTHIFVGAIVLLNWRAADAMEIKGIFVIGSTSWRYVEASPQYHRIPDSPPVAAEVDYNKNRAHYIFNGDIMAEGKGIVKYRWVRSDGAKTSIKELSFSGTGTARENRWVEPFSWQLGMGSSPQERWVALEIVYPHAMKSPEAKFIVPPRNFKVTKVESGVSPSTFSGACPTEFLFTSDITAEGRGTVKYHWHRSDNPITPVQELVFDAPETKTVTTTWKMDGAIGATKSGWNYVETLYPNPQRPVEPTRFTTFTLQCESSSTPLKVRIIGFSAPLTIVKVVNNLYYDVGIKLKNISSQHISSSCTNDDHCVPSRLDIFAYTVRVEKGKHPTIEPKPDLWFTVSSQGNFTFDLRPGQTTEVRLNHMPIYYGYPCTSSDKKYDLYLAFQAVINQSNGSNWFLGEVPGGVMAICSK